VIGRAGLAASRAAQRRRPAPPMEVVQCVQWPSEEAGLGLTHLAKNSNTFEATRRENLLSLLISQLSSTHTKTAQYCEKMLTRW